MLLEGKILERLDLKTGGYIFLSLEGLEKKYLCSGSGTQICNVIQDILVHYSFSLTDAGEIEVVHRGSAIFAS